MPAPDREPRPDHDPDHDRLAPVQVPHPRGDGVPEAAPALEPEEAWAELEPILSSGRDPGGRLVALATDLDDPYRVKLTQRVMDLLKFPGDTVFDVLIAAHQQLSYVIVYAPYGQPPVTAAKVRAYVRELDAAALAEILDASFLELRKVLPGPMTQELPNALRYLSRLNGNSNFIRWLVETTSPQLAAHLLATNGDAELAATLDAADLWGWLADLRGAQGIYGLIDLHAATKNPQAKATMATLLGPLADEATSYSTFHDEHTDELLERYDDKDLTAAQLVELFARGQIRDGITIPKIAKALRRTRATADDAVSIVSHLNWRPLADTVPLVLGTPGAGREHVLAIWWNGASEDQLTALRDDAVRRALRKHLGKDVHLRDLVDMRALGSRALLDEEGLRRWFIEEGRPADLLWLAAAGTPAECARACRVLRADGHDFDWVYRLESAVDQAQLRRFAYNCGDAALSQYLRDEVIVAWSQDTIVAAADVDPAVTTGAHGRLDEALYTGQSEDVMARLADLEDGARATLAQDLDRVALILARVDNDARPRACHLLDLTFGAVAYALPQRGFHRAVVSYLRTRPAEEELACLEVPLLLQRAVEHIHPDPLLALPSLDDPTRLAAAIARAPVVIERLLAGSDPARALRLLSDDVVRPVAMPFLVDRPDLLDQLPRYQNLGKRGRQSFDRLAEAADRAPDAGGVQSTMDEIASGTYEDTDARAEERGRAADRADNQKSLADAIDVLYASGAYETSTAIALVGKYRAQVPELLRDPGQWSAVERLRDMVGLLPMTVFPELSMRALIGAVNTRRWLFEDAEAFLTLQLFGRDPGAIASVAAALDGDEPGARGWLERLPVGAALTDREEAWLDRLQAQLGDAVVVQTLFRIRFGVPAPAYDLATIRHLYQVVSHLPDGHVQQERIKQIVSTEAGPGFGGYWSPDKRHMVIDDDAAPGKDVEETPERASWMTREQVQSRYGFDDATLAAKVAAGLFEERQLEEGALYRIVTITHDKFTSTVLHEVGHSVDDILGSQTEVIFGLAGWRQYGLDDFDTWAAQMGGWDRVTAADRAQIREAWGDSVFSRAAVKDLVPADHPALAARYAGVGIVDDARAGKRNDHEERTAHGDRVFISQPHNKAFYTVPERTSQVAPSDYSMYAPAEYFAECYVEYYRQVDGTAEGQRKKGGALPAWIKQWFDAHVDRVRFDPKRLVDGDEDGGDVAPRSA